MTPPPEFKNPILNYLNIQPTEELSSYNWIQ